MSQEFEIITETSIRFEGRKYTKKPSGYYYNCSTRKHLHQAIWISHNGPIPQGYEIHHIDFNNENNDISNLVCIPAKEHHKIHADALTEEQRQWKRDNLDKNARPKASEWHKSEEGREWHRNHAKQMVKDGTNAFTRRVKLICSFCGKEFLGKPGKGNHFCGNNCKARFLRRKRSQDKSDTRKCVICGIDFKCSQYATAKTCSPHCACKLRYVNISNQN